MTGKHWATMPLEEMMCLCSVTQSIFQLLNRLHEDREYFDAVIVLNGLMEIAAAAGLHVDEYVIEYILQGPPIDT